MGGFRWELWRRNDSIIIIIILIAIFGLVNHILFVMRQIE